MHSVPFLSPYVQLTVPVPAVIVVTFSEPDVPVVPVSPAPKTSVLAAGYRRITIPDPPLPPLVLS
jgi:hypothetical protein